MGQYYMPVLTQGKKTIMYRNYVKEEGKKEYIFLKLMEHSWWGNSYVTAIAKKLYKKSGRLAWYGDYTDDVMDKITSSDGTTAPINPLIWAQAHNDIYMQPYLKATNFNLQDKYLINLTKKEYVDLTAYYNDNIEDEWCIHPLPLLTATSNGRSGGDYYGINQHLVGRWMYDRIIIRDKAPNKQYKQLSLFFTEE